METFRRKDQQEKKLAENQLRDNIRARIRSKARGDIDWEKLLATDTLGNKNF